MLMGGLLGRSVGATLAALQLTGSPSGALGKTLGEGELVEGSVG